MTAFPGDQVPMPGALVAGKYQVVRTIGEGGMGVVLEASHLSLGQNVALKLLRTSLLEVDEVRVRFEREGRAVARLQGPHVARILDVDMLEDGTPFMVMELLRGRELAAEMVVRGTLPVQEAVGYVLQACAGMAEAHRAGIVHRDLKPSNLFLHDHGGYRAVKVVDFGISKLSGDVAVSVTQTASAFGTPLYMSPEQVRSVKHVDARSDIWSLGVVLYELLTGKTPFVHDSATAILASIVTDRPKPIAKLRPDIPSKLADAVMTALEKNPDDRFADVRELAAAIAPFGPPLDAPGQAAVAELIAGARVGRAGSRAARRRMIGAIVGVAGGLALATAAILVLRPRETVVPVSDGPTVQSSAAAPASVAVPASASPHPEPMAEPEPSSTAATPATAHVVPKGKPPTATTAAPKTTPSGKPVNPKYL